MRILSFDTSTSVLNVSLLEGGAPALEREVAPAGAERQEVASLLMPEIDRAFRQLGWQKRSLDLIVVGVGPGSFTGIRVGVITARTLAQVLNVPLMGVSILESFFYGCAAPAAAPMQPTGIVIATTGNQCFYGAFERTQSDPAHAVVPPAFGSAEIAAQRLSGVGTWYADNASLSALGEQRAGTLPLVKNIASIQAQLACDRLSCMRLMPLDDAGRGSLLESFPWHQVLPLYVRSPSVTVKKNHATANPPSERS